MYYERGMAEEAAREAARDFTITFDCDCCVITDCFRGDHKTELVSEAYIRNFCQETGLDEREVLSELVAVDFVALRHIFDSCNEISCRAIIIHILGDHDLTRE